MASSTEAPSPEDPTFTLGERVLCFEPDPNKVRVVYDAKILQVRQPEGQDDQVAFLVHFQVSGH